MKMTHDDSNTAGSELVEKFSSTLKNAQNKAFNQQHQRAKEIQAKKESYEKEFGEAPQGIKYALDDQMEKLCRMKSHLPNE